MQIFSPDNLPNIVKSLTTNLLTLAATNNGQPTTVTVGGQQFSIPSTITLNASLSGAANRLDAGTLAANTLYYVYAIVHQNTLAVALVASLSGPSSGPANITNYGTAEKLVGAFYTNGLSQVGSVVPIVGAAVSDWMSYTPTGTWITNTTYSGMFRRVGDSVDMEIEMFLTGAPNNASLYIAPPLGLTFNAIYAADYGLVTYACAGTAQKIGNARILDQYINILSATGFGVTQTTPGVWANGDFLRLCMRSVPILGWSNTLL